MFPNITCENNLANTKHLCRNGILQFLRLKKFWKIYGYMPVYPTFCFMIRKK